MPLGDKLWKRSERGQGYQLKGSDRGWKYYSSGNPSNSKGRPPKKKTEIVLSFTKLWVTHLAKFQKFDNFCRLVGCKIFQTPGTAAVVSELHAHTSAWSGMPDNADV